MNAVRGLRGHAVLKRKLLRKGKDTQRVPCEFLKALAQTIADPTPSIKVPGALLSVLRAVIEARRWAGHQFHEQATIQEEDGHEHYLHILEAVHSALAPLANVNPPTAPESQLLKNPHLASNEGNIYLLLDLEETSPGYEALPSLKRHTQLTSESGITVQLDDQDNRQEKLFATACFLMDCYKIRKHVQSCWRRYKNRAVVLIVPALTTDTAVDMLWKMSAVLERDFPDLADHDAINSRTSDPMFGRAVEQLKSLVISQEYDPQQLECLDEDQNSELRYTTAYRVLSDMRHRSASGVFPEFSEKLCYFDWMDGCQQSLDQDQATRITTDVIHRIASDCIIRMDGPYSFIEGGKKCFPYADHMTEGFAEMHNTKKLPPWLVVGSQILVDTLMILREDAPNACAELQAGASEVVRNALKQLDIMQDLKSSNDPPAIEEIRKHLQSAHRVARSVLDIDEVANRRAEMHLTNPDIHRNVLKHSLIRHHPLLSGKLLFQIQRALSAASKSLANQWGAVVPTFHLYHAARQFGFQRLDWAEAEALKAFQNSKRLMLTVADDKTEVTLQNLEKRLYLSQGASILSVSGKARQRKISFGMSLIKRANIHELKTMTPMLDIMRDRYKNGAKRVPGWLVAQVESELPQCLAKTESSAKRSSKSQSHEPLEILELLTDQLVEEERLMTFDYFRMSRHCNELLDECRKLVFASFPLMDRQAFDQQMLQFPIASGIFTVITVFGIASRVDEGMLARTGEIVLSAKEKVSSKLLESIGKRMDDVFERQNKEVQQAPDKTTSRMTKYVSPDLHWRLIDRLIEAGVIGNGIEIDRKGQIIFDTNNHEVARVYLGIARELDPEVDLADIEEVARSREMPARTEARQQSIREEPSSMLFTNNATKEKMKKRLIELGMEDCVGEDADGNVEFYLYEDMVAALLQDVAGSDKVIRV